MRGYFFDATQTGLDPGGDPIYDREYSAADHAGYYEGLFTNGVFLHLTPDACKVVGSTGSNAAVRVNSGRVFANGYMGICDGEDVFSTNQLTNGLYRVIVRCDISTDVRAFSCELIKGTTTTLPPLVRTGSIYDLCLANVEIVSGNPIVVDTRYDTELCGCASITGAPARPPYYPPGDLPAELWEYVLFPEVLTPEQRQIVEENPQLMEIWANSRIYSITQNITDLVYPVGSIYMSVNDVNPSLIFGGSWVSWGAGRVVVGVDGSDADFNTAEKTGGDKNLQQHTHTFTGNALAAHTHTFTGSALGNHSHSFTGASHTHGFTRRAGTTQQPSAGVQTNGSGTSAASNGHTHNISTESATTSGATQGGTIGNAGAGTPSGTNASVSAGTPSGTIANTGTGTAQNLQPYITCYMFKRVS